MESSSVVAVDKQRLETVETCRKYFFSINREI